MPAEAVVRTSLSVSAPAKDTDPLPMPDAATDTAMPVAYAPSVGAVLAATVTTPSAVTVDESISATALSSIRLMASELANVADSDRPAAAEIATETAVATVSASVVEVAVTRTSSAVTVLPPSMAARAEFARRLRAAGTVAATLIDTALTATAIETAVGTAVKVDCSLAVTTTLPVTAASTADRDASDAFAMSLSATATPMATATPSAPTAHREGGDHGRRHDRRVIGGGHGQRRGRDAPAVRHQAVGDRPLSPTWPRR